MKTKLISTFFGFLLLIGIAGTFWGSQFADAASGLWNSCPRGETDCAYPGKCRSYIDTNGDKICDRSQPAPQTASTTPAAVTAGPTAPTTTSPAVTSALSIADAASADIVSPGVIAAVPEAVSIEISSDPISISLLPELKNSYYFIPVLLVTAFLYAVTWTLSSRKIIRNLLHRKIWNLVLLVSMLVSALLGIFLILAIDYNIEIPAPFNMLFWHVEAGIALGIIGIFHILWHWRYFAKMLKAAA